MTWFTRRVSTLHQLIDATRRGEVRWRLTGSYADDWLTQSKQTYATVGSGPRFELKRESGWNSHEARVVSPAKTYYRLWSDEGRVDGRSRQVKRLYRAIADAPAPTPEQQHEINLDACLFQDTRVVLAAIMRVGKPKRFDGTLTPGELRQSAPLDDERFGRALAALQKDGSIEPAAEGRCIRLTMKGIDVAWLLGNRMYDAAGVS